METVEAVPVDNSVERVENLRIIQGYAASGYPLLGIFAKRPHPGRVKTRLVPPLSSEEAATLYRVSLQETVQRFTAPGLPFRTVLFYADDPEWFLEHYPGMALLPQEGKDLGAKMTSALGSLLESGATAAALVGSDSPDLPTEMVEAAFSALKDADAVTVPAGDGGYVLVGKKSPCSELFQEVDWSTDQVLRQTRLRARAAGILYREIGKWEDVDDLDSLQRLIARSPESMTARQGLAILKGLNSGRKYA